MCSSILLLFYTLAERLINVMDGFNNSFGQLEKKTRLRLGHESPIYYKLYLRLNL
jgi:hypothetical protein